MIRVQKNNFDTALELHRLTSGNPVVGGVCSFIGLVRDFSGEQKLNSMTLEHYPGMTEKELAKIDREAHQRWPLEASLVVHRYGKLEPGEQIVLVATASKHRQVAFEACEFLIDFLKTRAPFWKKEEYINGEGWVKARQEDDRAADRWCD